MFFFILRHALVMCLIMFSHSVFSKPTTYPNDYFEQYNSRTALDMLNKIPGFIIQNQDNSKRGLGQIQTNVLLNGSRVSGKKSNVLDVLSKMPSESVIKIEIGEASELKILGLIGKVANVITGNSGVIGQYSYEFKVREDGIGPKDRTAGVSLSKEQENLSWVVSANNVQQLGSYRGPEFKKDSSGKLLGKRNEIWVFERDRPNLSSKINVKNDKYNASFSGIAKWNKFNGTETSDRFTADFVNDGQQIYSTKQDDFEYEVGGNIDFKTKRGRLKAILLYSDANKKRSSSVEAYEDLMLVTGSKFDRDSNESEALFRLEDTFSTSYGNWQLNAEVVKNNFASYSELFAIGDKGEYLPKPFSDASPSVSEVRFDTGASLGRKLSDTVNIESSIALEKSKITQNGIGRSRSFVRPKGSFSVSWQMVDSMKLSTKLSREVGQLNFLDFIASVGGADLVVNATNLDIVPEEKWRLSSQISLSKGKYGDLSIELSYEDLVNIIDQIPIGENAQAPGNAGSGERFSMTVDGKVKGEAFGIDGLEIDINYLMRRSQVLDPVTGLKRRISNELKDQLELEVRQKLGDSDWVIGGSYFSQNRSARYRTNDVYFSGNKQGYIELYVETKAFFGSKAKMTFNNVLDRESYFRRVAYQNRENSNGHLFVESRERKSGMAITFSIEGSF